MTMPGSGVTAYAPPAGLRGVVSGVGAVRERLAEALAAQGVRRPLVVCGPNVGASPLVAAVTAAAGLACEIWRGSREHTPVASVDAGAEAARACGADAVIALGGSSAIDCAKGIVVLQRTGARSVHDLAPLSFARLAAAGPPPAEPPTPLICIPTTLSAAEFQPFFGARDLTARRKEPYGEQGLAARTVFLDGEIAAATPAALWLQTGIKAIDDSLSRYCNAQVEEPAFDAVQACAIGGLMRGLAAAAGGDAAARQANFVDVWLTTHPMPRHQPAQRRPWFSTAARHALGGAVGLAHGVASCVGLVEALRFHAAATAPRQAGLARLLDLEPGSDAEGPLAPAVARLLQDLGLPTRLGPLGIDRAVLDDVVANMLFEAPDLGPEPAVRAACARLW
jgi:maleylacetate reductase